MTEDELIEKVAGEMADADNEGGDYGMTGADVMDCERGREAYVKRARAALSAIREALQEPTDAMIDAGDAALFNAGDEMSPASYIGPVWKAMLSASPLKGET
jgi:hypothetical protein